MDDNTEVAVRKSQIQARKCAEVNLSSVIGSVLLDFSETSVTATITNESTEKGENAFHQTTFGRLSCSQKFVNTTV